MSQPVLASLREGESGYVSLINTRPSMTQRLSDLGLVPGTQITCVIGGTTHGPSAYLIRGSLIALRRADAAEICVTACPIPVHE